MAAPISVLIVDDDRAARAAMRCNLDSDPRTRVSGEAAGVAEALIALSAEEPAPRPDVILLDVSPGPDAPDGIDAVPRLREAASDSRILVTSAACDEAVISSALSAGADGYVWKNESASGIATAVTWAAAGRLVVTKSMADRILASVTAAIEHATYVLPEQHRWLHLTQAVRKVVYLYCLCGLSVRDIADELQVSVGTVNAHIRTAYGVLGAASRREAFERLVEWSGR